MFQGESKLITDLDLLKAQRNRKHYLLLVRTHEKSIPNARIQAEQVREKMRNSKGILGKLRNYSPIIGREVELHKLDSYIKVYSQLLVEWKDKLAEANDLIEQAQRERKRFYS